jgi:hypothetical protein
MRPPRPPWSPRRACAKNCLPVPPTISTVYAARPAARSSTGGTTRRLPLAGRIRVAAGRPARAGTAEGIFRALTVARWRHLGALTGAARRSVRDAALAEDQASDPPPRRPTSGDCAGRSARRSRRPSTTCPRRSSPSGSTTPPIWSLPAGRATTRAVARCSPPIAPPGRWSATWKRSSSSRGR